MYRFAAALGLALCAAVPGFAQTPPAAQPGAEPGRTEAPSEGMPTQGTKSSVTPVPGHVTVHFPAGGTAVPDTEHAAIARLAGLCRQGQASTIVLVGYPDAAGDPRKAIDQPYRRAAAVMEALLAQGNLQRFGWELSAEAAPDRRGGESRAVIGRCR